MAPLNKSISFNCVRINYPSLLSPLHVPSKAQDFLSGLSSSAGYECVLVVVDKFTKFAHFIPMNSGGAT